MNLLKNLRTRRPMFLALRKDKRRELRAGKPKLQRGETRTKPPQPTIIAWSAARGLRYLEEHGLADFSACNLVIAKRPISHVLGG